MRDDMNLTAPALATTAGSLFVGTGANAIAERIPSGATIATQQTTASTTYTNLATVGPQVAVTTGTKAFVIWGSGLLNNTGGQNSFSSVSVSGATPTIVGTDAYSCQLQAYGSNAQGRFVAHHFYASGLTAGSNTWTQVYRVDGGTGSFVNRELVVIPL